VNLPRVLSGVAFAGPAAKSASRSFVARLVGSLKGVTGAPLACGCPPIVLCTSPPPSWQILIPRTCSKARAPSAAPALKAPRQRLPPPETAATPRLRRARQVRPAPLASTATLRLALPSDDTANAGECQPDGLGVLLPEAGCSTRRGMLEMCFRRPRTNRDSEVERLRPGGAGYQS
jgi:hypothetical protein